MTKPGASSTSTTSAGSSGRRNASTSWCAISPRKLPKLRRAVTADLRRQGMPRERALACAIRLLDLGFFRVGSEVYAEENESFGLATVRREHVTIAKTRGRLRLPGEERPAPGAVDPRRRRPRAPWKRCTGAAAAPRTCSPTASRRRMASTSAPTRSTSTSTRRSATSSRPRTSAPGTAPCWRRSSWPARKQPRSEAAAKRAIAGAVKQVSEALGNTPAVCRASYIDPRVLDRYRNGDDDPPDRKRQRPPQRQAAAEDRERSPRPRLVRRSRGCLAGPSPSLSAEASPTPLLPVSPYPTSGSWRVKTAREGIRLCGRRSSDESRRLARSPRRPRRRGRGPEDRGGRPTRSSASPRPRSAARTSTSTRSSRPFMTEGDILGHEPMGIVEEVGPEVTHIAPGDRVVIPFNISCGHCWMCDRQLFAQCETTQNREEEKGASLSATPSSTARCRAGRPSTCACRRPTSARSRCPRARPTTASSTSPTCCRPPGRRSTTRRSPRAARSPSSASARSAR